MKVGYVELDTKLNTDGVKEGIGEIKDEYSDEEIEFVSKDQEQKVKIIDKLFKGVGTRMRGIASRITGISSIILKTIAKLGLIGGIIGIITLVGTTLVKAFSTAIQKNEELKTKVDYIKYSVQSIYETVGEKLVGFINWILNGIIKILSYIGGVVKAVTGINIFAKATKENFKAMQESSSAIRKNFAGFDEMETLDDSGGLGLTKDINGALSGVADISSEVDKIGDKIKKYFSIPSPQEFVNEVDTRILQPLGVIWDATLGGWIAEFWKNCEPIVLWIYNNVILPIWNDIVNTFLPIYNWFVDNIFKPIKKYIIENVWNPIKTTFSGVYVFIYNKFVEFYNAIAKTINEAFGRFGVHVDELKYKTINNNGEIEESLENDILEKLAGIDGQATDITNSDYQVNLQNNKINEANTGLSGILDKLRDIVSRTWNATIKFFTDDDYRTNKIKQIFGAIGLNIPWLASGGIVNLPSRGVPVGGAMTGEHGAEGVLPLTGSQSMETLGEAIGRYVTINANITNTMNGRVISREIQRIQNESDFAFNR